MRTFIALDPPPLVRDALEAVQDALPPGLGRLVDAEQLFRRLQFAVANRSTGPAERLRISGGIAELRSNDDPISFFERADDALYEAKQAGKGRAIAGIDAP